MLMYPFVALVLRVWFFASGFSRLFFCVNLLCYLSFRLVVAFFMPVCCAILICWLVVLFVIPTRCAFCHADLLCYLSFQLVVPFVMPACHVVLLYCIDVLVCCASLLRQFVVLFCRTGLLYWLFASVFVDADAGMCGL